MRKLIFIGFISLASMALTACKGEHSVDYYKTHDKERGAKVEECKTQSEVNWSPDCRNAMDAYRNLLNFGKPGETKSPVVSLKPIKTQ